MDPMGYNGITIRIAADHDHPGLIHVSIFLGLNDINSPSDIEVKEMILQAVVEKLNKI